MCARIFLSFACLHSLTQQSDLVKIKELRTRQTKPQSFVVILRRTRQECLCQSQSQKGVGFCCRQPPTHRHRHTDTQTHRHTHTHTHTHTPTPATEVVHLHPKEMEASFLSLKTAGVGVQNELHADSVALEAFHRSACSLQFSIMWP